MYRTALAATAATLLLAAPVGAKRVARAFTPVEKLVRSDAVVVGKVTALEKDEVLAPQFPGAPDKVAYRVAVVKVQTGVFGAANVTHLKVGFLPPPVPPARPGRGGYQPVNLTTDTEALFYLRKHHSADFYTADPVMAPTGTKEEGFKAQLELVARGAAVLADPVKALGAEKGDDRTFAAALLVAKYRSYPDGAPEVESVPVPAEEGRLILKALAAADWTREYDGTVPTVYQAFGMLGLNPTNGFRVPVAKPGENLAEKTKAAFAEWLAGPGKDYRLARFVPKTK